MTWEDHIMVPDGQKANFIEVSGGRLFKLEANHTKHKILSEIEMEVLGYNNLVLVHYL